MVLGRLKDLSATAMVRKCLLDKNDSVHVAAIYAMHRLGHAEQTDRLPNYVLLHPDPIVRRNAAIAISMFDQQSAVTVLARAMKDPDPGVRHHALEGMARLGNKEAARELSFMVNSGIGSEEVFAINALAGTGDPIHEDAFRYKLSNASHLETRLAAARALGRLGIDAGLPIVLDSLKPNQPVRQDPDDPPADQLLRIRQLASAAAGAIGNPRAVPMLETFLGDGTDPRIQISAARALIEIAEKQGRSSSPFPASPGNRS
jgi:HEAT repeat protein